MARIPAKFTLYFCLLGFSVLSLNACGFSPVYGTAANNEVNQSIKSNLNDIEIANIINREGQYLRNALIDRFYFTGTPTNAAYILTVSPINESTYDFDITQDSEATRRQIKLRTSFTLEQKSTDNSKPRKPVLTRNLTAVASYNVLESEFSTIITEQNARENTLDDLARQIERDITLYFNQ